MIKRAYGSVIKIINITFFLQLIKRAKDFILSIVISFEYDKSI